MAELMKRTGDREAVGAAALIALTAMAALAAAVLGEAAGELIATGMRAMIVGAWSIG